MKKKKLLSLIFAVLISIIVVFVFEKSFNVNGFDEENWIMNMIPLW